MNLYTIIFSDREVFKGGSLEQPKWQEIPSQPIRSIFYSLPSGDVLCLANFKKIYHFVEATKDVMGDKKGQLQIEFSHLIIERGNDFLHYKIDQRNNNIECEKLTGESEMIKELNPEGWKNGIN